MRLYEFDPVGSLITKLVAVTDQLQTELEDSDMPPNWSVDQLLNYFRKYDIALDVKDLYNMIKKPPLKNVIDNIQGDNIIFKGQSTGEDQPKDEQQKIVKSMAQNAMK